MGTFYYNKGVNNTGTYYACPTITLRDILELANKIKNRYKEVYLVTMRPSINVHLDYRTLKEHGIHTIRSAVTSRRVPYTFSREQEKAYISLGEPLHPDSWGSFYICSTAEIVNKIYTGEVWRTPFIPLFTEDVYK